MPYTAYNPGASQFGPSVGAFTPINPGTYWNTMPLNILPYYRPAASAIGAGLASGLAMGEELAKMPAIMAETQAAKTQAQAQVQNIYQEQQQPLVDPTTGEPNRAININSQGERSYVGANALSPGEIAARQAQTVAATSTATSEAQKAAAEAKAARFAATPPYDILKSGGTLPPDDTFSDPFTQNVIKAYGKQTGTGGGTNAITDPNFPTIVPKGPKPLNSPAGQVEGEVVPNSTAAGGTPKPLPPSNTSATPGASPHGPQVNTPPTGVVPAAPNQVPNVPGKPDPATGQLNTHGVLPPDEALKWYKSNYSSAAKSAEWSPATQTYTVHTSDGKDVHVSPQQIFQNLGHYTPPSNFTSEVDAFQKNFALHQVADKVGQQIPLMSPSQDTARAGGVRTPLSPGLAVGNVGNGPTYTPGAGINPVEGATPLNTPPAPLPSPTLLTGQPNSQTIPVSNAGGAQGVSNAGANPDSDIRVTPEGKLLDTKTGDYIDENGQRYQGVTVGTMERRYYPGMRQPVEVPSLSGENIQNQNAMLLKPSKDGRPAWTPEQITTARQTPEGQAQIQNEISQRYYEENSTALPEAQEKDIRTGKQLIENGLEVDNALQHMKNGSADYNWWHTALAEMGDKFGNTPIAGNVVSSVNKALGLQPNQPIPPAVTQLYSAFEHYVNVLPHDMFGRVSQQELGLIRKIVGDPADQNSSFADRFRNDLVQRQESYVENVNQALTNRYKVDHDYVQFAAQQRSSPILQRYLGAINNAAKGQQGPNLPMYQGSGQQPQQGPNPARTPLPTPKRTPAAGPSPTPSRTPITASTPQVNRGSGNTGPVSVTGVSDPVYKSLQPGQPFVWNGRQLIKQ